MRTTYVVHADVSSLFIEKKYHRLCWEYTSRLLHLNSHSSRCFSIVAPIHPVSFVFVFHSSFLVLELISLYCIVPFFLGISSFLLDSRFLPSFNTNLPPKSASRHFSIHPRHRVSTILNKCSRLCLSYDGSFA